MTDEVLVSRSGRLGLICLNRPKALNSLTLGMVRVFRAALDDFGEDPEICGVLVYGAGERAFCAGGDIRALYEVRNGDREPFKTFWREEYALNARIASFPKPYVVFMDGLVMGGGVGVSAHGNRRIVTERTRLAMPETSIGFIPDVGATWLLSRARGVGAYMAFTSAGVEAADAIHAGFADFVVRSEDLGRLRRRLEQAHNAGEIESALSQYAQAPGGGLLQRHKPMLEETMARDELSHIVVALQENRSEFAHAAAQTMLKMSPTSLKLTHALLQRARHAEAVESCLTNEFRAACRLLDTHDLYEGIRAAIIDKDRNPHWSPPTLAGVDDATIEDMLRGDGGADPLYRAWGAPAYPKRERMPA